MNQWYNDFMKVVIASDSFKGCMSSLQACRQIEKGLKKADENIETSLFAMADGGEGTAEVLGSLLEAEKIFVHTKDAYGKDIETHYFYDENQKLAVMDAASCVGLNMTERKYRNPMIANSFGLGLMMKHAVKHGAKKIIIGLGGTGTNDGGLGILEAFGASFYNSSHKKIRVCPLQFESIAFVDKRNFFFPRDVEIIAACDVKNRLLGPEGATYVFGGQKGLYKSQIKSVEKGMQHIAGKIQQTFHTDMNEEPGSGAAGGIGAVLLSVLNARMESGISLVMKNSRIEKAIAYSDLVITGEGQTDRQTSFGKVPFGIAQLAKEYNVPCICLSGALGNGYESLYKDGVCAVFSTANKAMSFEQALATASKNLEDLAENIGRFYLAVFKEDIIKR